MERRPNGEPKNELSLHTRTRILAAGVVAALSLVLVMLYATGMLPTRGMRCLGRSTFSSTAWQSEAEWHGVLGRGCVVDDYLRRHAPVGRSREDIVRELGQPRPTDYFREYDLVYWVGPERGVVAIDSEWLVLRFDTAGRVSEGKLVTD